MELNVCPAPMISSGVAGWRSITSGSAGMLSLDLRIGVAQSSHVSSSRPRIQVGQQRVVARIGLELRDAAVLVVDIAEYDRLGGTSRLTRGLNFAVAHLAILLFRVD